MLLVVVTFVLGVVVGLVGAFTWPKWTAYLARRAAASKLSAAQALIAKMQAEAAALDAAKAVVAAAPPPAPVTPTTGA